MTPETTAPAELTHLALAPTAMQLHIDGTDVKCTSWAEAIKILAGQARIREDAIPVATVDTDGTAYSHFLITAEGQATESHEDQAADTRLELSHWVLSTKDRDFDHFRTLESATSRLQDVAEATHADVPVQILGLDPAGPVTRTISPVLQESPVPNGTGEPLTEDELTEQIEDTQVPEPADEPQQPAPDAEEQEESETPIAALARLQAQEQETTALEEVFPGLEPDDPEHQTDLDETDPDERPASRWKPRLLGIGIAAVLLLVIAGFSVLFLAHTMPTNTAGPAQSQTTSTTTAWGQSVSEGFTPAVSVDRKHLLVANETGFIAVDAHSGETVKTVEGTLTDRQAYPYGTSGFYITAGTTGQAPQACLPEGDSFTCQDVPAPTDKENLIHRAGTIAYQSKDGRTVRVLTGNDTKTFHAPDKTAAYAAQDPETGLAVWAKATTEKTGSLASAAENGAVKSTTELRAPEKGATILSWIGPTQDGHVAILWSGHKGNDRLILHDRASGEAVTTTEIPTGAAGDTSITDTGSLIQAKDRVITASGKSVDISKNPGMKTSGDVVTNNKVTITGTGDRLTNDSHTVVTTTDTGNVVVDDHHLKTIK